MRFVAAILLLGAIPAAANAQMETDTGSLIPVPKRARVPEESHGDRQVGRIVGADFARCVVARNPKGVGHAFDLPPGPAYVKAMTALATDECLGSGNLRIPQTIMRGTIFVELYRRYDAKKPDIVVRRPVVMGNPLDAEYRSDPMHHALLEFADCVIKRDAADARDVVRLPTASKMQDAAFKALIPNLGPCIVGGQKITFSRSILEGVLAEVMYRGTEGPAPVAEKK